MESEQHAEPQFVPDQPGGRRGAARPLPRTQWNLRPTRGASDGDSAESDSPSSSRNNFLSSAPRQDKFPVVSVRGDHYWNDNHRSFVTVRWAHLHEFLDDFFHNAATGNFQERIPEGLGLDHVWTLSP